MVLWFQEGLTREYLTRDGTRNLYEKSGVDRRVKVRGRGPEDRLDITIVVELHYVQVLRRGVCDGQVGPPPLSQL